MENKINIAELLKDCPKGMELDCILFDDVYFDCIDDVSGIIKCYVQDLKHSISISFNKYGGYSNISKSKCAIFPKGKTTWEGFVPPCKFKVGDIIFTHTNASKGLLENSWVSIFKEYRNNRCACYACLCLSDLELYHDKWEDELLCELCEIEDSRLATEEEKQKLFDAIKANGYKWNAETKTLEKLIKPKFKVDDKIKLKGGDEFGIITQVSDCFYTIKCKNNTHCWPIKKQDDWELINEPKFKVGDKVTHNFGILMTVVHMYWDAECNVVRYDIQSPVDNNYKLKAMLAEHLQPYKEETMEERKYADLRLDVDQDDKLATEATIDGNKITPPDNYLIGKITKVDNGVLVEFVKKQPQYPKTYEECCEVIGYEPNRQSVTGYLAELIEKFQQLLICRDAYWKITGEQMGLGKSWEPDWNNVCDKYTIYTVYGKDVWRDTGQTINTILAFPTAEMRDAFYENFKELINETKELL